MSESTEYLTDGTLRTDQLVTLPEILDVLIVGGGPAGTAAAFRSKELGLSALVIDFDDLMKRIRDYAKGKLIYPDYGGGDKMKFPQGGKLISLLHFSPLDKDEMCKQWKGFYRKHNISARIGLELIGIEQLPDRVWQASVYNHNTKTSETLLAKHVVIAIGRGVPRRFDIPGNLEGISYRLSDAAVYVGKPALVIGGGTSAAEAVIAISNAKNEAKDASAVFWSYRGDKLPKVSKALADVFFDAYMGNGNIRHYPYSEPVAVTAGEDQNEYLSLRIDRRSMADRPGETSHLEFEKDACLACIGEDLPTAFLAKLGIQMAAGGTSQKKRFLVTPILETVQKNVFLVGDLLSPVYLETDDFKAAPDQFREIRRRGNIKAALRDGVLVADAIEQKLAGKKRIEIDLDSDGPPPAHEPAARNPKTTAAAAAEQATPENGTRQQEVQEHSAYLIKIISGNVEADEFAIAREGVTTIGRRNCEVNFPDDLMLSEKHASIAYSRFDQVYYLRDDGSQNGVFVRIRPQRQLQIQPGHVLRAGRQHLLFHRKNGSHAFSHFDRDGKELQRYELKDDTIVLGRSTSDIVLDESDMTLSRRHLSLSIKGDQIVAKDLASANGTFIKVKNAVQLSPDDQFRIGQQHFKFRIKEENLRKTVIFNTEVNAAPVEPQQAAVQQTPAPAGPRQDQSAGKNGTNGERLDNMMVEFKNFGKRCSFQAGESICDIADRNGIALTADCRMGSCGIDPIRVISGEDNMNEVDEEEAGTLEDLNRLDPGAYRLACMAKPKGAVTIEILEQ